ncbi:PadR family transcriptional regulator [Georgenia faecalis]|uniref:PadR family transcriptional regulator n=1 Tax=Georgenia faecalis TaxID=2483799 RepID=A0ABV9DA54_9MICO|nr:PadR family transcriptional regulator [Georgenia faecalis]
MSTRAEVLDLAVLGRLATAPMHGYELRKHLGATLGPVRALSYGSLYPSLRRLTDAGLIAEVRTATTPPHALSGRRARIVYELTDAGRVHLAEVLAHAEPAAWDDDAFTVRFTLFAATDARTRLRILEGRHARMVERLDLLRGSAARTRERMDSYTAELARYGLEQAEREVAWLEDLIDTERGTRGPLDLRPATDGGPPRTSTAGATGVPDIPNPKEQL